MIRAGQQITIEASGDAESFWTSLDFWNGVTAEALRSDLISRLMGIATVISMQLDDRGVTDLGTWQYRASIIVAPRVDRDAPEDLAADVQHALYEATGYLPRVSVGAATQPALETSIGSSISNGAGELLGGLKDTIDRLLGGVSVALIAAVVVAGIILYAETKSR